MDLKKMNEMLHQKMELSREILALTRESLTVDQDRYDDLKAHIDMLRNMYDDLDRRMKAMDEPVKMESKKLSISLPVQEWPYIDQLIADGHVASYSEYFRRVHMHSKGAPEFGPVIV